MPWSNHDTIMQHLEKFLLNCIDVRRNSRINNRGVRYSTTVANTHGRRRARISLIKFFKSCLKIKCICIAGIAKCSRQVQPSSAAARCRSYLRTHDYASKSHDYARKIARLRKWKSHDYANENRTTTLRNLNSNTNRVKVNRLDWPADISKLLHNGACLATMGPALPARCTNTFSTWATIATALPQSLLVLACRNRYLQLTLGLSVKCLVFRNFIRTNLLHELVLEWVAIRFMMVFAP